MRGDDGSSFLELTKLERDGGADHGSLPFERNAKSAHPGDPIVARSLKELARDAVDRGFERLVGAEYHRDWVRQRERRLVRDIGERGIGRQAQYVGAAVKAHVVGADGLALGRLAVVEGRPQTDGDARQPAQRLDAADDLGGVKRALEAEEARREISDANGVAASVLQHRLDDGGIAHVLRVRSRLPVQDDVAEPLLVIAGEQPRKHRLAIETREAPPDDAAARVDQRCDAAIADGCDVKCGRVIARRLRRHTILEVNERTSRRLVPCRVAVQGLRLVASDTAPFAPIDGARGAASKGVGAARAMRV